ncbi:MAG: MBL fold metallo-hydrolase [Micropepsaceae bacterium]
MRFIALCLLALSTSLVAPSFAQVITGDEALFEEVADGVYAFLGRRNDANALVVVTNAGVVLVDTGNNPPETRRLQEFIRSVTDQPVRYVVISQNHGDHIGGLPLFAPPAQTIAHEKVAEHWASWRPHQINSWRKRFPEREEALREVSLTDNIVTFSDHMTLKLGGRVIELIYIDDAYNPGDIAVWLPEEGVMHAGFAGYIGRHPDIRPDYSHGTTAGILKQLDAMSVLSPRVVIPAHGPLGDASAIHDLTDYLLLARSKVRTMMDQGYSLESIVEQFEMDEFEGWDREEHYPWMAETLHREFRGEGPQIVTLQEQRRDGTILNVNEEGRRLVLQTDSGEEIRLRIGGDSDIEGVPDRSALEEGMRVSVLYAVAQGANAAPLGFDVWEMRVAP